MVENDDDTRYTDPYKNGNGRPLPAVRNGPFYVAEVRPAIVGFTAAGL